MSDNGKRYVFSGYAVGFAAEFDRLGDLTGLNHVVPSLGPAVLPVIGGFSQSDVSRFDFRVDEPSRRSLVSIKQIRSRATGKQIGDTFRTEVHSRIEEVLVVDKLSIGIVELHMSATRLPDGSTVIRTDGNRIGGVRLGQVFATVVLDDRILHHCGSQNQLREFADNNGIGLRKDDGGYLVCSLVSNIVLSGPEGEVAKITRRENALVWPGFGTIFFAEVQLGAADRKLTLVRLQMGSDASGSGVIGDGGTNGHVST